jgi:hypothetical protein
VVSGLLSRGQGMGDMPRGRREKPPEQAVEILRYYLNHPQAADTVEGVARWRLLEETVYRKVDETREAIEWLVAEDLLVKESPEGAQPVFRLNPRMAAQASRLVRHAAVGRRRDAGEQE